MNYRKMNEAELRGVFGRYSYIERDLAVIPYLGKNVGLKGVPDLKLAMPFMGVPLTKENTVVDPRLGFKNAELVKDFYSGFDEDTIIIPGTRIKRPESGAKRKCFYVTFNPDKVNCVLIGWKCNQNTSETVRSDLRSLAEFYCSGKPDKSGDGFWDYYVFSIRMDYNYVANSNEHFLSDAKYHIADNQLIMRKSWLRETLTEIFGPLESLTEMVSVKRSKALKTWLFKDDLHHYETWVADEMGRFLKPDSTSPYTETEKVIDAEVSSFQVWKNLPEKCIVLRYERDGVSQPAKYTFLKKPKMVTNLQLDAISVLEERLLEETHELITERKLFERFALRGIESRWLKQLNA